MKVVRFATGGRVHTGEARDGALLDEAGRAYREDEVVWLPPVEPRQVIGLALNYADHASELSVEAPPEPALFFKPITSLVGHRAPVVYPTGAQYMHYEIERPEGLVLTTRVNGEVRQQGNTNQLMRSIPELIAYITDFMTLDRDDMILTGTPKGISPVHPGDVITMEISRIGVLENRIVAEDASIM